MADIFSEMDEEDHAKLRADILRNGLKTPIVLYEGKVLSGRARYRVCLELRLTPKFVNWDGNGTPLEFLCKENVGNRRFSEPQRAMAAARAVSLTPSMVGRRRMGAHSDVPTRERIAFLFGVNLSAVGSSYTVLTRGTKEEIALVEFGKLPRNEVARQIGQNVPPEARIKERRRLQDRGARDTMTKMGQVAYAMLAEVEEKQTAKALKPKPVRKPKPFTVIEVIKEVEIIKEVEVIKEVPVIVVKNEADTFLARFNLLLKDTAMSPNEAAVLLAKEIPSYSVAALLDWMIEVQERMDRIIRKRERDQEKAA